MNDIYFLNADAAFNIAVKQNISDDCSNLQLCYYHGELVEGAPSNMINVPVENIYEYFSESSYRIPTAIDKGSIDIEDEDKEMIVKYINKALKYAVQKRKAFELMYKEKIENISLNYKKILRIFFVTSRCTPDWKNCSYKLANAFEKLGYKTLVSSEDNNMQTWEQTQNSNYFAWHLKNMLDYKPHIVITEDDLYRDFIPKNMFNIVFTKNSHNIFSLKKKDFRKRDFIFTNSKEIKNSKFKNNILYLKDSIFTINKDKQYDIFAAKILDKVQTGL